MLLQACHVAACLPYCQHGQPASTLPVCLSVIFMVAAIAIITIIIHCQSLQSIYFLLYVM
jgi:hypothetical protein